jgi:hypothetical protein
LYVLRTFVADPNTLARMKSAALGIRMHSGWGILVAVTDAAEILERRRISVIRNDMTGGKQPYHHAERLGLPAAEKYLASYICECDCLAREDIQRTVSALHSRGYRVAKAALLLASGRRLPSLSQILAAHPLIHSAEGELFRETVRQACESLTIPVLGYKERELEAEAIHLLGDSFPRVVRQFAAAGKSVGPPWTADHKSAALGGYLALTTLITKHASATS